MNPRLVLPILVGLAGCPTDLKILLQLHFPQRPRPSPSNSEISLKSSHKARLQRPATCSCMKRSNKVRSRQIQPMIQVKPPIMTALTRSLTIAPIVWDADLAFANLETPVAPKTGRGTCSKVFNVSASLLPALDNAGFDLLSFANNHVYDQGGADFEKVLSISMRVASMRLGQHQAARTQKARIVDVNGIRIAVLAATTVFNDAENSDKHGTCASFFDEQQTIEDVKQLRGEGAEIVMLSLHWGREYRSKPRPSQVDIAHDSWRPA